VQALRVDPVPRGGEAPTHPRTPAASGRDTSDPTTLGDLADKLEEALAQEVQSARNGRPEPATDEFGFDAPPRESPRETPPPPPRERLISNRMRQQKPDSERTALKTETPSPEPERRRESASERREEAPVISLNARRRESSDSLEDEMARLLGELTGDTKGR
jgi:hypothetical protein